MNNIKLEEGFIYLSHDDRITIMKKFPSGNLISASFNIIKIWDNQLELIDSISIKKNIYIGDISIENENSFVICLENNLIQIYNYKDKKWICIEEFNGRKNEIKNKIIISKITSKIFTSNYTGIIEIYEKKILNLKYQEVSTLKHDYFLNTMLLIEDKNILISSGETCTIFWNIEVMKLIYEFPNVKCYSKNAIERINNDTIVIGDNYKLFFLSLSKLQILKVIEINDKCYSISNINYLNHNYLVIGCYNQEIILFKNYEIIQNIKNAQNNIIYGLLQINDITIASYSMWTIKLWKIVNK